MKFSYFLFIITFLFNCTLSNAYASKLYRHVPVSTVMTKTDTIVIEYDLSGKSGIYCTANTNLIRANFTYKGNQKSAYFPIVLQNYHVPDKAHEELADEEGQFTLTIPAKTANKVYDVKCNYLSDELVK